MILVRIEKLAKRMGSLGADRLIKANLKGFFKFFEINNRYD